MPVRAPRAARRGQRIRSLPGFLLVLLAAATGSDARGLELFDGRLQFHGFYEMQMRSLWEDFDPSNAWDLSQWYHVGMVEIEGDLVEDPTWIIDEAGFYLRLEVRYDCVWRRACGLFRSADAYGHRAEHLPERLQNGRRSGYSGTQFTGDRRPSRLLSPDDVDFASKDVAVGPRRMTYFWNTAFGGIFTPQITGLDQVRASPFAPGDDPAFNLFRQFFRKRCWGSWKRPGPEDGGTSFDLRHNPDCKVEPVGIFRSQPNPFRAGDFNPLTGTGGAFALPFRPAPVYAAGAGAPRGEAEGLFVPSAGLARELRHGTLDPISQNIPVNRLEWNFGASQDDEYVLKEAYLDLDLFEGRLWLRLGKQMIVWGKTELFRTTDQFNPQDLALASLPSLEESRIALWAVRASWSFYDIGFLKDVRLELALNYDQFEPADLGVCGEPYNVRVACGIELGMVSHGITGIGLAGVKRPPNPWNSWKGIEVGMRLEWRWDRFSFALVDFYGFSDFPTPEQIFRYSRNVDPRSGRPRHTEATGACTTGSEPACLTAGTALAKHSVNQQIFHQICAATVTSGLPTVSPEACGIFGIWNSFERTIKDPAVGLATFQQAPVLTHSLSAMLSGQNFTTVPGGLKGPEALAGAGRFVIETYNQLQPFVAAGWMHQDFSLRGLNLKTPWAPPNGNYPTPLVPIQADPLDGAPLNVADFGADPALNTNVDTWRQGLLSPFLSDAQEALLGCGPFYGTHCDIQGVDLLNAEASALFQSWPGFEGTFGTFWDVLDGGMAQPGTVGFQGGPVCTRYEGGQLLILPGCRAPGDPGYDPNVDGTTGGQVHPFTGQAFRSEMAILSWNFLMMAVAVSRVPGDPFADPAGLVENIAQFDPFNPLRNDGCSFRRPQFCNVVQGLLALTGVTRPTVRAGGNGRFGRRDFAWATGQEIALRYEKRNVLGFSMDFAEDQTKTNWSFEFTWIPGIPLSDSEELEGLRDVDAYNLTVSVDRPTFINFLNANRTFFINTQWFFQYLEDYRTGIVQPNGPWNVFFTLAVTTGYFQDRLLPTGVVVYDFGSNSGAFLPSIAYRMTENFSVTVGGAVFFGRFESRNAPLHPFGPQNRVGRHAGKDFVQNGLAAIHEKDELFLTLRYTF